jgi:predicted Zn finger-like uncharacterized protein
MEVRCERCRAQYVFADDQVGEHGLTVRCSNCGHLFKVKKKAMVVTLPVNAEEGGTAVSATDGQRAASAPVTPDPERKDWSLRQPAGQIYAFKDMSTLHRWIVERKAHREDEISRSGEPWRRLGSIPELQSFFAVVEAAERAAYATPAATQPTMVQYPAQAAPQQAAVALPPRPRTEIAFPVPSVPPPPRTEVAFPATGGSLPPRRTEVAYAPPAARNSSAAPAPSTPRTDTAFPPVRTDAAFPPTQRTDVAFPPPPAARSSPPPPPAPPPASSPLERLFAETPVAEADPFAHRAMAGGTEQGYPPPPAPSAAPARLPSAAAWEGGAAAASAKPRLGEPAWASADQQTTGMLTEGPTAPRASGSRLGGILAVALATAAVGGGAAWFFRDRVLQALGLAPTPVVIVPVPAPPAPAPEAAKAAPPVLALAKPVEPSPAGPGPAGTAVAPEAAGSGEPGKTPETGKAPEPGNAGEAGKAPEAGPSGAKAEAGPGAEPVKATEPPPPPPAEVAKAGEPAKAEESPAAKAEPPPAGKAGPEKVATVARRAAEPKGAKALLAQARRLRDRGKSQQALDLYGQAVALEPKNADALAGRGWCYLDLSQYGPAEASFESSLELDPEGADALLGLAETYRYAGRRGDAVKFYERYLAAHPDGEDAVAAQNAIKSLKE